MIQKYGLPPSYDLNRLKKLISNSRTRHITFSARNTAHDIGFASDLEVVNAVKGLVSSDFYKTMPSTEISGVFQDVYKKTINGVRLYIKLQERPNGRGVVVSFKKDTGGEV